MTDPLLRKSAITDTADVVDGELALSRVKQYASQHLPDTSNMLNRSFSTSHEAPGDSSSNGRYREDSSVVDGVSQVTSSGHNHVDPQGIRNSFSVAAVSVVPKIRINQESSDAGSTLRDEGSFRRTDVGKLLVRMKALGHRRSSSAPIKQPSHMSPSVGVSSGDLLRSHLGSNDEEEPLGSRRNPSVNSLHLVILFFSTLFFLCSLFFYSLYLFSSSSLLPSILFSVLFFALLFFSAVLFSSIYSFPSVNGYFKCFYFCLE